ncbi:MAG: T9SS type A sorting domain-containing protein [Bacteroidales bacterium]|jgi:hypothetical protein|nr:T9SS type A sorting domain-containing protein [Bacteroidales bacterium]
MKIKNLSVFFLVAIVGSVIAQDIKLSGMQTPTAFDCKSVESNFYLDTLWVSDSILTYRLNGDLGLLLHNTYKILTRNELGNKLTSTTVFNEEFPESKLNHLLDSTGYFNGTDIKKLNSSIWIPELNEWRLKKLKIYEEANLLKKSMEKTFSASLQEFTWGDQYLYENSAGRKDVEIIEAYVKETDSWKPVTKIEHFYDNYDNDTLILTFRWKNNMWVDSLKQKNFFLGDKDYQQYYFTMNGEDSIWHNLGARFLEYSASGLNTQIYEQTWDEEMTTWVDMYKVIITYDDEDRMINYLYLEYNSATQQLENSINNVINYVDGKTVYTYQNWDFTLGLWHNYNQYVYSFVKDDLVDTAQNNVWNDETQQWKWNYRDVTRYDDRFNEIDMTRYNFVANDWLIAWKYDFYWSPFIPNATYEIQANTLAVYPNPATTQVSFVVPDNQANTGQQALLTIFDLSGRQMTQLPLQNGKAVWDCAGVKAGLYVYSLSGSGAWVSGKVVVR